MSEFDKETKYTFLPWFRIGLGTKISNNEQALRPKVSVELKLKRYDINSTEINETVTKEVFLYGPGDVEAILKNIVIRIEPKPNELNFEANYLSHIEFSQIDFPWRYTPTSSDSNSQSKLLPWICLIVLKGDDLISVLYLVQIPKIERYLKLLLRKNHQILFQIYNNHGLGLTVRLQTRLIL